MQHILDNLFTIKEAEKELWFIQIIVVIKGIGLMIKEMEMDIKFFQIKIHIKENFNLINQMDMEFLFGIKINRNFKEIG